MGGSSSSSRARLLPNLPPLHLSCREEDEAIDVRDVREELAAELSDTAWVAGGPSGSTESS